MLLKMTETVIQRFLDLGCFSHPHPLEDLIVFLLILICIHFYFYQHFKISVSLEFVIYHQDLHIKLWSGIRNLE